jgi:hypothetical protein
VLFSAASPKAVRKLPQSGASAIGLECSDAKKIHLQPTHRADPMIVMQRDCRVKVIDEALAVTLLCNNYATQVGLSQLDGCELRRSKTVLDEKYIHL